MLRGVLDNRITLCISRALMRELRDVASRPKLVIKLALAESRTAIFLARLETVAELIETVAAAYQHPVDPKDTMVVNLAIAASAQIITSRERHLLSLRDASTPIGRDFISRFKSVDLMTPTELLQRLANSRP